MKTIVRGSDKVNNGFIADKDGDIRIGQGFNLAEQAVDIYAREKGDDDWIKIHSVSGKNRETFTISGVSAEEPDKLYVIANRGEDTTGAFYMILKQKHFQTVYLV